MIKKIVIAFLIIGISLSAFAEEDNNSELSKGNLTGYVYDSNQNKPLEYATIALINIENGSVVNGTISDESGFFQLKNINPGVYRIEITFIGYEKEVIERIEITNKNRKIELGQVMISPASESIDEVVVTADRPTMTYKIDKKVINVSQQHTSASGTAVEILENVPSVTVDIEGNVSLRGSQSFTVLIDNKPTVLDPSDALSQIPASAIENIEIITNPSAKYDPDGTSGIVNIITKRNKMQGMNGVVNLNAGMYDRYGGDFLVNYRREKFSVYVGADINTRNMYGSRDAESRTYYNDTTSYILSDGDFNREGSSYSFRGGVDYNFNAFNTLSFEARYGNRDNNSDNETNYHEFIIPGTFDEYYISKEESERGGDYLSLNLSYIRKFNKKGHELYALVNYSRRDFDSESTNRLINENNNIVSGQRSIESGPRQPLRFQLDYTLPLSETNKFEAGYQSRMSDNTEKAEMFMYDTSAAVMDFVFQDQYSNTSNYRRSIHSLYAIYSGELGNFGYQGGVRGEYTYRDITIDETNENFNIDRWDIFPTVHVSYNLPKENQMMASYTRRIDRPRGWYLEPFLTWSDAYNVRQGNPGLEPEYIDSYELSYLNKFGRNSFSFEAYYRVTHNKIERVRSVYSENVFLSSFENVGKDYALGIESMLALDVQKWWHVDLMGNLYDYRVEGQLGGRDFSESSFNWNIRFNNILRFSDNSRLQFNAMYNSPTISAQGERSDFFMANLAYKHDFLKKAFSATLQVRDVFGTMKHSSTYSGDDFYSYSYFEPKTPFVSVTLTYRINNYRPDRQRGRNGGDNMQDFDEGEGVEF
ncbi:MAG: TonB-dependent receptor [Bacteroidota bacterium]|nr:TonB-dependent receptor [Bacteroidota bacterium]